MGHNITTKRLERAQRIKFFIRKTPILKQALTMYADEVGISYDRAIRDYYQIIKPTLKKQTTNNNR